MKNTNQHVITEFVTTVIQDKVFGNFLRRELPPERLKQNLKTSNYKSLSSVSGALKGFLTEYYILILLSKDYIGFREKIYNEIDEAITRYEKRKEECLKSQEPYHLENNIYLYKGNSHKYLLDLLTDITFFHKRFNIDFSAKTEYNPYYSIVSESGYRFISAEEYYGFILYVLFEFKNRLNMLYSGFNISLLFSNPSFVLLFAQAGQIVSRLRFIDNSQSSLGRFESDDIGSLVEYFSQINTEHFENSHEVSYQPTLGVDIYLENNIKCYLRGTPDFMVDNKFIEVKATKHTDINHCYQMLIYYILSMHDDNIPFYGSNNKFLIFYTHKNKYIELDFPLLISDKSYMRIYDRLIHHLQKVGNKSVIYMKKRLTKSL